MAEASYIVLRRYEGNDPVQRADRPDELWHPVASVDASSGEQAIRKVSEPDGQDPIAGDYWAVAARYSQSRERVVTETKVTATREKLPPIGGETRREPEPVEA